MGYPVVMKILSPDITHKTDVGGVELNLQDDEMVLSAFRRMMTHVSERRPDARIDGVTIQPMVQRKNGIEMILGLKKDPVFGTVMMVGTGGTAAELFRDRALGFPPLNERLARRMLESLKIWPLLQGYRGQPPSDIAKLIEVLIRLSYLAADYPEITELDINPLLVAQDDIVALDARIIIDRSVKRDPVNPYTHLAMRPYPDEYVRTAQLHDGTSITLRPIKPEDEPMWLELLRSCSRESIYQRFRFFFHWDTHEVATRYCFIDYDREIAIVAELETDDKRELLGVGRLIADPDHESVEYAILVSDAWQDRGLGSIITDHCMTIAAHWGLKKIVAQTTTDNPRMLALFDKRGFKLTPDPASEMVDAEKELY
jgi:acetyltransferase